MKDQIRGMMMGLGHFRHRGSLKNGIVLAKRLFVRDALLLVIAGRGGRRYRCGTACVISSSPTGAVTCASTTADVSRCPRTFENVPSGDGRNGRDHWRGRAAAPSTTRG